MKLFLKRMSEYGGVIALCDEQGNILPAQAEVEIFSEPGELTYARVKFYIDGKGLQLAGEEDAD